MFQYLVRRLLWACVLFIAVTLVTYVIFFVIPVDPARLLAGKNPTQAGIIKIREDGTFRRLTVNEGLLDEFAGSVKGAGGASRKRASRKAR